jgi:hypothetical protein
MLSAADAPSTCSVGSQSMSTTLIRFTSVHAGQHEFTMLAHARTKFREVQDDFFL